MKRKALSYERTMPLVKSHHFKIVHKYRAISTSFILIKSNVILF